MTIIVATNVIASRLHERRPTGTPHARANFILPIQARLYLALVLVALVLGVTI